MRAMMLKEISHKMLYFHFTYHMEGNVSFKYDVKILWKLSLCAWLWSILQFTRYEHSDKQLEGISHPCCLRQSHIMEFIKNLWACNKKWKIPDKILLLLRKVIPITQHSHSHAWTNKSLSITNIFCYQHGSSFDKFVCAKKYIF